MSLYDGGDVYAILPTNVRPRRIQPGKRTILVSVLLSTLLLMSQLLRALQLDHPPKLTNVHSLQSLTNLNHEQEPTPCIRTYIGNEKDSKILFNQSCQRLPSTRGLCSLTQNLFFSKKPPDCRHQTPVTFCVVDGSYVHCKSPSMCGNMHHYIGIFNENIAKIQWKLVSHDNLQQEVSSQISDVRNSFGFLFVKCSNNSQIADDLGQPQYDEPYPEQIQIEYTQLLLYPPKFEKIKTKEKLPVNINLVMIDSLSRTHFYRSLPNTVNFLESLNEHSKAKVLDFQLHQAVKQRTYESLQMLFSGYVNTSEVPFGTYDVPRAPLPVASLFGKFKKKGYRTLWMEDLCWNWEWGLVKDLKVMNDSLEDRALWLQFKKALQIAQIDSIDFTLASCDILAANSKKDPFRNLPKVCFNGRHHHEYILEYLQMYQNAAQKFSKPFITYTSTSVSHDESGVRVQSLDDPLVKYLKFAAKLEDTLTIVFADHGNTYGKFIESSPEANAEVFNPALFMIVPQGVQTHLGDLSMRILKDNEKRLVSLLDLHHMLLEIIGETGDKVDPDFELRYVVPGGLLSSISFTRTCRDIPLLHPNLCICRDYETLVEPTSSHMALAEYGLGILNNMILSQYRKNGRKGFGNCPPLKAVQIRQAKELHMAVDVIIYKLDVIVESVESKKGVNSLFFLTLEAGRNTPGLKLISYERHDAYSIYGKCQDGEIEIKLCVCNYDDTQYKSSLLSSLIFGNFLPGISLHSKNRDVSDHKLVNFILAPVLEVKPDVDYSYPKTNPCLFTIIHRYKYGIILKALNFCSEIHKIEVVVKAKNLWLSSSQLSTFVLRPRDFKTLIGGISANTKSEWDWDHDIKIL